ncbi:hypothetical protein ACLI09_07090 [Flavobacterium sp. RHBU_24]|uniref:hypothetical protein n=1 Tax=Flavobacterium sp. RHBU_24 TaxID=3391185 RepID=UPI003985175F
MKKIVALVVMMLGFGVTASAQTTARPAKAAVATQSSFAESAKKDVAALDKVVALSAQEKQSFQGLFEYKYRELEQVSKSEDRKAIIAQTIEAKVRATLTPEKMAKLEAKPEVLKQITH